MNEKYKDDDATSSARTVTIEYKLLLEIIDQLENYRNVITGNASGEYQPVEKILTKLMQIEKDF